jgi:hypothetical protein
MQNRNHRTAQYGWHTAAHEYLFNCKTIIDHCFLIFHTSLLSPPSSYEDFKLQWTTTLLSTIYKHSDKCSSYSYIFYTRLFTYLNDVVIYIYIGPNTSAPFNQHPTSSKCRIILHRAYDTESFKARFCMSINDKMHRNELCLIISRTFKYYPMNAKSHTMWPLFNNRQAVSSYCAHSAVIISFVSENHSDILQFTTHML